MMDKYSKIIVIDIDKNGMFVLNLLKENGYTNSAIIDKRYVQDEMLATDYITQFTPNLIVLSGYDKDVYLNINNPSQMVDSRVVSYTCSRIADNPYNWLDSAKKLLEFLTL